MTKKVSFYVEKLLTSLVNIKMNAKVTDGLTSFMIACQNGHKYVVIFSVIDNKNRNKLWTTSLCPLIQAFINEVFPLISSPFKSILFTI